MRRVLLFLTEYKRSFTLFTTIFLSVSMMLMGESAKTHFARAVTTAVFNTGRFTFSWGIYILDLSRENKRLRLKNLELSGQISRHDIALWENERLKRQLGFKERFSPTDSAIVAMVIGHDFDRIVNALILDAGSRDGVKENMSVVTAEGLIGCIYKVYPSSCSVQILMDLQSKASAVVEVTNGIIRWEGGPYLRMYGLPLSKFPIAGSKVYTTGLGGVFPGGILIGTVAETKFNKVERYASVNVKSAIDFSSVQEVFILKGSERSDIWNNSGGEGQFQRPEIH